MATKKVKMVCKTCRSDDVRRDAFAAWDVEEQKWVLDNVFDYAHCCNCEDECSIEEMNVGGAG